MSPAVQGLLWCLVFAVLDAAQAVVFGRWFQALDSFQTGFLVFAITSTATLAWVFWSNRDQMRQALASWKLLLALNFSFAIAWASFLMAIQILEPAIAFSLFTGLIPIVTIALAVFGGSDGQLPRNRFELVGNAALLAGLLLLCWTTLSGRAGFLRPDPGAAVLGLSFAILAGVAISYMLFFSKRLHHHGVGPTTQFAMRFGVYLILSLGGWIAGLDAKEAPAPLSLLILAVPVGILLMAFPVFAVQKAIALSPVLTIATFSAASPVFVFVFQLIEGRVDYAPWTLAGLVLSFAGAMIAVTGSSLAERVLPGKPPGL
ncbi:MAG: hypothetical protein WBO55_15490 [Rhizobiaceae bacterium]